MIRQNRRLIFRRRLAAVALTISLGAVVAELVYGYANRPIVDYQLGIDFGVSRTNTAPYRLDFAGVNLRSHFLVLYFQNWGRIDAPVRLSLTARGATLDCPNIQVTNSDCLIQRTSYNGGLDHILIGFTPSSNAQNFSMHYSLEIYNDGTLSGFLADTFGEVRVTCPTGFSYYTLTNGSYVLEVFLRSRGCG